MEEPQPHDSQNQMIEPSDYRTLGFSIHYRVRNLKLQVHGIKIQHF